MVLPYRRGRIGEKKVANLLKAYGFTNIRRTKGSKGPSIKTKAEKDSKTTESIAITMVMAIVRCIHLVIGEKRRGEVKWNYC